MLGVSFHWPDVKCTVTKTAAEITENPGRNQAFPIILLIVYRFDLNVNVIAVFELGSILEVLCIVLSVAVECCRWILMLMLILALCSPVFQICRLSSPIAIAIQTAIVQVWEPCSSMNDGLDELQESWKQQ